MYRKLTLLLSSFFFSSSSRLFVLFYFVLFFELAYPGFQREKYSSSRYLAKLLVLCVRVFICYLLHLLELAATILLVTRVDKLVMKKIIFMTSIVLQTTIFANRNLIFPLLSGSSSLIFRSVGCYFLFQLNSCYTSNGYSYLI